MNGHSPFVQSIRELMTERARLVSAIEGHEARVQEIVAALDEVRALLLGTDGPSAADPAPSVVPGASDDRESRVVALLRSRGPLPTRIVAQQLGVKRDTAFDALCDLRARHVIASSGNRAGLRWHLPKEGLHAGRRAAAAR